MSSYIQLLRVWLFWYITDAMRVLNQIWFKSTSVFNTVEAPSVAGPERPVWNTLLTYVSLPFTLVPFRKGHLNMLRIPFKEMPSYVCESTRVCVGAWVCAVRVLVPMPPHTLPTREEGFWLEPFQLLMHYRQIGPQIGLFAVDWHHTEMTSPLKWRGPPLTLWPLLKQQLQYNSFMSGIWL